MRTDTTPEPWTTKGAAERAERDRATAFFEAATRARGRVPGLEEMAGRLVVDVAGQIVGTLEVDDGVVSFSRDEQEGTPNAILLCTDLADATAFLEGRLNPFVAAIQGRAFVHGDVAFALEVISSLRVYSPFATPRAEGAPS